MLIYTTLNSAEKLLLTVSGAIALSIFLVTDPVVFSTDSNAYLRYADAISKLTVDPAVYSRQAGYPLLLVATLYPWILSVIPVLAIQACCAALTPLLIYRILHFISPRIALCGAWVSIATLLPYNFQTYLFPDPIQIFLCILFCYTVLCYIFGKTTNDMITMFLVYLALSFFRPPFLLFYLIIATVVAILAWKDCRNLGFYIKPFVVLTIIVSSLHIFASTLDAHLYKKIGVERKTLAGKMIFLNAFTRSTGVEGAFTDGKYTNIMRNKLISFFRDAPEDLRDMQTLGPVLAHDFEAYKSDPKKMTDAILNTRNNYIWGVLFNISENWFGSKEGDRLFMKVALEQYRIHPKILFNVISTGLSYYLGIRACIPQPHNPSIEEYKCRFWPAYYPIEYETFGNPHYGIITGVRPYTLKLIDPVTLKKITAPFSSFALTIWPSIYRLMLPTASILTLLVIIFTAIRVLLRTSIRAQKNELTVLSVVLCVFLFYSIPMFMLSDPQFRYVSAGAIFLIISGTISLRIIITGFMPEKSLRNSAHSFIPNNTE